MLKLVLGIAGTGKTTHMLDAICSRAQAGKKSILLVPEQFSSSAEMLVYKRLGDALNAFVEVVSFRTLAERILKLTGGLYLQVLDDAARAVFVRRALDALDSEARSFARHRHSAAFCAMCADTINELKTAGATPAILRQVAGEANEEKLAELALIYEAYEAAIAQVAVDAQDRLLLAAQRADCGYFNEKACFIDNFDGFTAPEYALILQLVTLCEETAAALCCDTLTETDGGLGRFSPVRKTAARLLALANKASVRCVSPLELPVLHRCKAAGPAAVNQLLALGEMPPEGQTGTEGLTLTEYPDEWEECRQVAAQMHTLALNGAAYSSMAVVCREITRYETALCRALDLFEIPYFIDAPVTVEYTPVINFLRAALRLLQQGLASEPVLALLKTGLCGYSESEIAAIENYVYTWRPKAADWRAPFKNNPAGLLAGLDEAAAAQLETAERVRGEIIFKVEEFTAAAKGCDAAGLCRRLYLLLDRVDAAENDEANKRRLALKDVVLAEEGRRAWDVAMDLLDQMAVLVGGDVLPPAEFEELFLLLVRSTDFGRPPQVQESVIFTSADRMRLADPDHCFVLGICEGEFPMQVGYSGLLTHTDRELLVEGGVEMPGSFENRVLLEEMFFYRALTSPRKALYLSWPARLGGETKTVSSSLEMVCELLAPPSLSLTPAQLSAAPAAAFDRLGALYRENTPEAAALYKALLQSKHPKSEGALRLLARVDNNGVFALQNPGLVQALMGGRMTLSATRAERYYQCRFSYFMERILHVKPRPVAEISPMESGTFVHHLLEMVLRETGAGFKTAGDDVLSEITRRYAEEFAKENLPPLTRRETFILEQIVQTTVQLLCYMRDAAAQSDFSTDALELSIADGEGNIPPLEVQTATGQIVRVTGQIDRVDTLRQGGKTYLCIVDYKTGTKKFSMEDVFCGLNMQMLIYMSALRQNAAQRYPNAVPAAMLYLTSDPAPLTGTRQAQSGPVYKMDGILLQDSGVLKALEHSGAGLFLPLKHKEGKPLRAGQKLAGLEKLGNMQRHVEKLLAEMGAGIYGGSFPAQPLVKNSMRPCDYCPYRAACRHENGLNEQQVSAPDKIFEPAKEESDGC